MNPIRFQPIYQERVWGGRWLAARFGRELEAENPIGEAWEIVDRPEAQSVCTTTGHTLRALLEKHSDEIMGPLYDPSRPFPILVKWLDCSDRLSLQVHPPEKVAAQLNGEPKTECWYLADTTVDAALIVGLRQGVTRALFEQAIKDEALEPLLHRFPVKPGESILLESGRLHAIDAGNLILEIQQNSDTTYRVYDWSRKGLDGKPRPLHVAESLKSIDFEDFEPTVNPAFHCAGETVLAECPEFRVRQCRLKPGEHLRPSAKRQPMIFSIIEGRLHENESEHKYLAGHNLLVPYAWEGQLNCHELCTVLITDHFT